MTEMKIATIGDALHVLNKMGAEELEIRDTAGTPIAVMRLPGTLPSSRRPRGHLKTGTGSRSKQTRGRRKRAQHQAAAAAKAEARRKARHKPRSTWKTLGDAGPVTMTFSHPEIKFRAT